MGFLTVDIRRDRRSQRSAPQNRHMAHLRRHAPCTPRKPSGWDGAGVSHSLQLGATPLLRSPELLSRDGCKTQAQPSLCLCGVPENLNLSGLDLRSACKPESASDSSWQSNLESEQCRLGKHTRRERGHTQVWLNHCEHAPVTLVRSVPPSPQHNGTSEPKK